MPALPPGSAEKSDASRDILLGEALGYVPKLLELADRDLLSPTYGCFDRAYWHYRTSDFPSGMYQEAVLPLALAWDLKVPGNPWHKNNRIRDLILAGIRFSATSAHRDSSCDDYFPFERASGATAFSLYACAEALLTLGDRSPDLMAFLEKRALYLAREGARESGTLSNHHALNLLAVYTAAQVTGSRRCMESCHKLKAHLLALQHREGWFPEYEGADPGYLGFTIDFLSKYWVKSSDSEVLEPLSRAVQFLSYFVQPDGTAGGEYGSRNTFHLLPHGLELLAGKIPLAGAMARAGLNGIRKGTRSYLEDDRIFIHYVYNYFQAYRDYSTVPVTAKNRFEGEDFEQFFEGAGLMVRKRGSNYAVISTRKGTGRLYRADRLVYSDSGITGIAKGRRFSSHAVDERILHRDGSSIGIEGNCFFVKKLLMKPLLLTAFRLFLLIFGRWMHPNIVRRIIQGKAMTARLIPAGVSFRVRWDLEKFRDIRYEIHKDSSSPDLESLWISTDATYMYVATSQPYQQGNLLPWISLETLLPSLNKEGKASYTVTLS